MLERSIAGAVKGAAHSDNWLIRRGRRFSVTSAKASGQSALGVVGQAVAVKIFIIRLHGVADLVLQCSRFTPA
jgi:hypothetical protein